MEQARAGGSSSVWIARAVAALLLLSGPLRARAAPDEEARGLPPPRVLAPPPPAPPAPAPVPSAPAPRRSPAAEPPPAPSPDGAPRRLPPPAVRVLRGPSAAAAPPPAAPLPGGLAAAPSEPPRRPEGRPEPRPEDLVFEVARPGGAMRAFQEAPGRAVLVMVGSPRITGFEHRRPDGRVVPPLSVKANHLVLWVDLERFRALEAFQGLQGSAEPGPGPAPADGPGQASVLQEAVLGLYAEGAVEVLFGDLAFRAEVLYLEPRTYRGLLVEPRFDGHVRGRDVPGGRLPLYVRARRARFAAKGFAVFDEAEVAASRAADRVALQVRTLTVEELQAETADAGPEPNLLGFEDRSAQRYRAEGTVLRAERIPLLYWPSVTFGYEEGRFFSDRVKRLQVGSRSSLGPYARLGIGDALGPREDPWLDWIVALEGYARRGPAGGLEAYWDRPGARGQVVTWAVWDFGREDRDGFRAPEALRWMVKHESRTDLADRLQLDVEFNDFADRGVNLEYFERDALEHKDRESYGRLRYQDGPLAATLTGKWHQRDFVTETTEEPQAALWLTSVPLLVPARRGGLALDVTTVSRAGRLARRFDEALALDRHRAWRLDTDTRIHLSFDLGDLRFTSYAGGSVTSYLDRTEGRDLTRTALLAGVRANLQAHRTWEARGGPFQLERLRHVIDLDLELQGRWWDSHRPADVPFFDLRDLEEERTAGILRVRNRLQTRARGGGVRNVLDLETSLKAYLDDVGPFGERSPGALEVYLRAQPREHVFVAGEMDWDLGRDGPDSASLGVGLRPWERAALFAGARYVRGESVAPLLDVSWRWSEKYGVRLLETYDIDRGENRTRLVFRRFSPDHIWNFGVSLRDADVEFQISLEPTPWGVGAEDPRAYNDEPHLDPWRAFP